MKLATYRDGSRDGQLAVVSRDLGSAHYATGIATRLQQALDDWNFIAPQLHDLYETLNGGKPRHAFEFDPRRCMAPLPRAYQWATAMRHGAGEAPGARLEQRRSDDFLGPRDDVVLGADAPPSIAAEAMLAAVTGDVPTGSSPQAALEGVRLLMIASDLGLAGTAFGPVAVTPDELGEAWRGGRVHLALLRQCNGQAVGGSKSGADMPWHFGELIARIGGSRGVRAGSIVGSGALDEGDTAPPGRPGDVLRLDMAGSDGRSVFGAIEQRLAPAQAA